MSRNLRHFFTKLPPNTSNYNTKRYAQDTKKETTRKILIYTKKLKILIICTKKYLHKYVGIFIIIIKSYRAAFAFSTKAVKPAGSAIAISDNIFLLISMFAFFKPFISLE